jgi:hypothetical protein
MANALVGARIAARHSDQNFLLIRVTSTLATVYE